MVWRNETYGDDVLGCDDRGLARHGNDRIEITRSQYVGKIAKIVGEKCTDQSKIGSQRRLNQVGLSVHVDFLLSFFDDRADSGWRQYSAEPKTSGANAFDKRALRDKIDSHFPAEHLLLRLGIESDVTRDRPAHQSFVNELSNAATGNRRVVCNDGE